MKTTAGRSSAGSLNKLSDFFMRRRPQKRNRGQSTIEYVLMVGFGAVLAIQIAKYFNEVFRDGLRGLERNVSTEASSGTKEFGGSNQ